MRTLARAVAHLDAFRRDERGTSVLTFAMLMPLVLLLVMGAAGLLQIMAVKSSLAAGVYDATQYLTYEARRYAPEDWERGGRVERDVTRIVQARLAPPSLMGAVAALGPDNPAVQVTPPDEAVLESLCEPLLELRALEPYSFSVETRLQLDGARSIPLLGRLVNFTVTEEARAHVECPRGWEPTPGREPCLFPGFWFGTCR